MMKAILVRILKGKWGSILAAILKAAGDGDFGPAVEKAYWWAAGKKTLWGIILLGVTISLDALAKAAPAEYPWAGPACTAVGTVAVVLTGLGLVDGGVREQAPVPPKEAR
jgi:hypothetical protein